MMIITIGNRLQNYALQKKIEDKKMDVYTIKQGGMSRFDMHKCLSNIKRKIYSVIEIFNGQHKLRSKRHKNFKNFNELIKTSYIYLKKNNKINKKYDVFDYYVIGSDQVWNPYYEGTYKKSFCLFTDRGKVVSYAPSFGVSDIPESKKGEFIEGLNHINKISVREEKGAEIVKKLTGRKAQVVLDPTLLLDNKEWNNVIKKPEVVPKKKYILTYFLGSISNERMQNFERIASENNFDIINLGKIDYPQYYIAGPSEFLWYIQNSEIIFTDSFHACVFSIIFDRSFYVMDRDDNSKSMNSRIDTLLSKFRIEDRRFECWENVKLNHNYENVEEILKKEKISSLKYLSDALGV